LQSNACNINWYEDLLNLNETQQLDQLLTAIGTISNKKFGFELDVDAIAKVNSSAYAPIGFSANSVMNFIKTISAQENCAYFHICEGAYQIEGGPTDPSIGKLIAYYVLQFVKNHPNL
jgi:formiminoglutamase